MLLRRRCARRDELAVGVGEEAGARDLQGVEEEEFGVARGGGAQVRVGGELCGGNGERLAKGHGF